MRNFLRYLQSASPAAYNQLSGKQVGSSAFNSAWKSLARDGSFGDLQHDFIQQSYYEPALSSIRSSLGIDLSGRSAAVQDALWSTAVQHGVGGAKTVFRNAGVTANMSDAEIIRRVYTERGANNGKKYFPSSSEKVRKGVVSRFRSEMQDALNMLR